MSNFKSWVLAFRPKTLTAALVPVVVATAWSAFYFRTNAPAGGIDWWVPGLALLASFCIQIGTNLVNDAVDFHKGADTEERIGPARVTQKGIFTSRQVMWMAGLFFLIAVICGIPLVLRGGWPIVAIGLASVGMGYAYTAGPFPLAYLGLGDLFVILFFGLVAVAGLAFLTTGAWHPETFLLGLQIGFLATVLIAINNLRDHQGDAKVGKRTLPVRFGVRFARSEIAAMAFGPFLLNLVWLKWAGPWAAFLPFLCLPLALKVVTLVFKTEPSPAYNQILAKGAGLQLTFGLLLSIGFALC